MRTEESLQNLNKQDLEIIKEEEGVLLQLKGLSSNGQVIDNRDELLDQIFELRETLENASLDDVGAITDQISRLTQLINLGDRSEASGINQENPYFAHVRLEEEEIVRDFYIGTRVYLSQDRKIQIVDWKSSPVSLFFYRYEEGEEYEEQLGKQWVEGVVTLRRILKIEKGELIKIQQGKNILEKDQKLGWVKKEFFTHNLHGGSGVATRAGKSQAGVPHLKTLAGGDGEKRFLPEITALIDENQFALITKPENGVIAIQGTAGSGKTTVGLHRVAWLHFQDKQRFSAPSMMVMVFNKALGNYISQLLPSLAIRGVKIDFYEQWAAVHRRRLFGGSLPQKYSEITPVSVIRLKKHPALLQIIKNFVSAKNQRLNTKIKELIQKKGLHDFPLDRVLKLSFVDRLYKLYGWSQGEGLWKLFKPLSAEVTTIFGRIATEFFDPQNSKKITLIRLWEELFSDFETLKKSFMELAAGEFSESLLDEAIKWMKDQYANLQEYYTEKGSRSRITNGATLDVEDDPILLLMYQKFLSDMPQPGGKSSKSGRKPLKYSHLMIDEAQDLSPIELTTLLGVSKKPYSITLAGDVNQQMIQNNGFKDWSFMFDYLGLNGQELSSLNISYRSTKEIMSFSMEILGKRAEGQEVKTTKHGPPVELFNFAHQGELTSFLADSLKNLMQEEPNASIAVICFSTEDAITYFAVLDKMEIPRLRLVADQDFSFTAGIDMTDVKQVKGLEFDYVILLDVDTVNYPDNSYTRFLLHIGATRAAHQLWLLNYRLNSMLLPQNL